MNHDAYDRIIDRYLNGEMKPEEEREFQELMKLDPDLNALFAADAVVGQALTSDRESLPAERPEAYAHFLGLLATSVPAAQMAASKSAAASASKTAPLAKGAVSAAAGGKGAIVGSILAGGAVKAVVATVAAVGIAVGSYFAVPALLGHGQKSAVEQQADRPAVSAPALRQNNAQAPAQTDAQAPTTVTTAPAPQQESKQTSTPSELRAEPAHHAAARQQAKDVQIESSKMQETSVGTSEQAGDHPQTQSAPKRLPVVTNNTVNTQMTINNKVKK